MQSWVKTSVILAFPMFWAFTLVAAPQTTKETDATTNSPKSTIVTNVWLTKDQIPTSVFEDNPTSGVDPFFPDSQRRANVRREVQQAAPTARPKLVLSGISYAGNRRIATINNRAFAEGEEMEVDAGSTRVRILCEQIGEDYAVVSYGSPPQRIVLRIQRY